jgi:nucleotide-binding universal stress UspA family protein
MRKALVVVDAAEGVDRIMREAAEHAVGVDGSLVLLHVTTDDEFEDNQDAMTEVTGMEGGTYDVSQASEGARQFADDLADKVLRNIDVEYETVGKVGNKFENIMQAAQDYDCDHIYMAGRKRSPSGKAIFGDTAQRVILNFDNPVTVLTRDQ